MSDTRTLQLGSQTHPADDDGCEECPSRFPRRCECGGLTHASVLSDSSEEITFATLCGSCGKKATERRRRASGVSAAT